MIGACYFGESAEKQFCAFSIDLSSSMINLLRDKLTKASLI